MFHFDTQLEKKIYTYGQTLINLMQFLGRNSVFFFFFFASAETNMLLWIKTADSAANVQSQRTKCEF